MISSKGGSNCRISADQIDLRLETHKRNIQPVLRAMFREAAIGESCIRPIKKLVDIVGDAETCHYPARWADTLWHEQELHDFTNTLWLF